MIDYPGTELEDLRNQILDLRYRVERLESRTRHTLQEHIDDVTDWYCTYEIRMPILPAGARLPDKWFFVAYERWLNNRPLLSEASGE